MYLVQLFYQKPVQEQEKLIKAFKIRNKNNKFKKIEIFGKLP